MQQSKSDVQAFGEQEQPNDVMLSDFDDETLPPPQPSCHQPLQPKGRANKPLHSPQARAANQQRPTGPPAAVLGTQAFRFLPMHEGQEHGTLPVGTWGVQQPGKPHPARPPCIGQRNMQCAMCYGMERCNSQLSKFAGEMGSLSFELPL